MGAPAWTLPRTNREPPCSTAIFSSTWISASKRCCATPDAALSEATAGRVLTPGSAGGGLLDRSSGYCAFGDQQVAGFLMDIDALAAAAVAARAAHGEIESREPARVGKVDVRTFTQEIFDHLVPAPECRSM